MSSTIRFGAFEVEAGTKKLEYVPVLERTTSEVKIPVGIIASGRPGPNVLITAGIHGSEYAGIEAAVRTWQKLSVEELSGNVVVIPVVNIPGFEAADPNANPMDGLNINRVFPGDPKGSPTLVLADWLASNAAEFADYVVDLHGGDTTEWLIKFAIFFGSGDQELDGKSARLAYQFDSEYVWKMDGSGGYPGTFSGELARRGVPCVTVEAGFLGTYREEEIGFHELGILNVLRDLKALPGDPSFTRANEPTTITEHWTVAAANSGIMYPELEPGSPVSKGDKLATIKTLEGDVLEELHAPADGLVRVLFPKRVVNNGSSVYKGWVF